MLDGILHRNNFKTKCKSALNRTKTRLEMIKKKRNAMQKFLKEDIAELLRNNLHRNAYSRAEGLYMELNLSSCYDFVEEFCNCIANHLKEMHHQRDCPEECKVAAASLIYAAARFADLPELRDLRTQFSGKYGKTIDNSVSQEFEEKLKSRRPTTEMKLQLMQDIANEYAVKWDPNSIGEQLQNPTLSQKQNFLRSRSASTMVRREEKKDVNVIIQRHIVQDIAATEAQTRLRYSQSSLGAKQDLIYKPNTQLKSDKNRTFTKDESFKSRSKEEQTHQRTTERKNDLRRGDEQKEGKMINGQSNSQDLPLPPWRRRYLFT